MWSGNIKLTPFGLPEALSRQNKKNRVRINKRIYGTSITARPEEISARTEWERAQNERHNRIFRRYIPKGVSIDLYSAEQILHFADEMNALPRHYGVREPEEAHKLGIKETNVQEKNTYFTTERKI